MTLLGAFIGIPGDDSVTQKYDQFVNAMGQTAGTMDTYVNDELPESIWVRDAQFSADSWKSQSWSQNLIPTIALPMASVGEDADQSFKNIISGSEDGIINGVFQAWASDGFTQQYLRPGWEMNGSWMPWSVNEGNAADYVAAFQHIANLAHSFSGANIQVVWNPNVGNNGAAPIASLYPGNSYVDVIGLDTYGEPINVEDSPSDTSGGPNNIPLQAALDLAKANGKPFAIPETGGLGTSFPGALASVVAQSGVQVAFVNIWDTTDGNGDLSWSGNPATAAAWKQAFQTIAGSSGSGGATVATNTGTPADGTTAPVTAATLNATSGDPQMAFVAADGSTAATDQPASDAASLDTTGTTEPAANALTADNSTLGIQDFGVPSTDAQGGSPTTSQDNGVSAMFGAAGSNDPVTPVALPPDQPNVA